MFPPEDLSEDLTNSKSPIKSKLIEEHQNDQYMKYSVVEDLQNGSEHKSVSFMVYNLTI